MAQLTEADYREIRQEFYRFGFGKEECKALASLPNAAQFLAGLQTFEDTLIGAFAGMKADFDTATGRTWTNIGVQKILAAYLRWKIKQLLGA